MLDMIVGQKLIGREEFAIPIKTCAIVGLVRDEFIRGKEKSCYHPRILDLWQQVRVINGL